MKKTSWFTLAGFALGLTLALGCGRRRNDDGPPPENSAELERVRAELRASQQRMQMTEGRIQALTQQQAMQQAQNQALRGQLQQMGTKMQQAQGRMAAMQRQARIARSEMEGLSRQASAMSQEAPNPDAHPPFRQQLGGIRNDLFGIARDVARTSVAHPGAFGN